MKKLILHFSDGSNDIVDYLIISDGVFSNTKSIIENKKIIPIISELLLLELRLKIKIF